MRALDSERMGEAIDLASCSLIRTAPNPRVGCVIYSAEGERLSEGVTSPPGGPHAEASALRSLRARGVSAEGASVYVTLEPCAHYGRTPPCALALVEARVARVIIGALDPNPLVSGRGVSILREAGVEVEVGVEGARCEHLHAPFFKWVKTGQPWVTLKGAMTLDGCLATASGHSKWITGEEARAHVHSVRAQVGAVMVGGETARLDRPTLNVRLAEGSDPRPVVLSRELSLPRDLPCVTPESGALLCVGEGVDEERAARWRNRGAEVIEVPLNTEGYLSLPAVLSALGEREITHLLVEGGGRLHGAFLSERLADDLHLYVAPKLIGRGRPLFNWPSVPTIPDGLELSEVRWGQVGADLHLYGTLS
jgi:diaminohydroxyphosphoribosylaminopyrimidine deaminase/5-amino-6-(5-phosphoribosylamino)uracil reductase